MARNDPGLMVRLPADLKDSFRSIALANRRSMTAEFVVCVERWVSEHNKEGAAETAISPRREHAKPMEIEGNDYAQQ